MHETPLARIVIVDDEAAQMNALCNTLRDHGYEAAGFTHGPKALAALRESKFDLLLTDLMMPEMDGIAVLRAALEADPNLVGILMTGEGTIATAVEAMKAGALDYILKPFRLSAILPVLARGLEVRRLRLENAALQQRVRERTAELEAANKELDAFAYSISHDLRAPLRHIDGFAGMLLRKYAGQLPAEAGHMLAVVGSGAQEMSLLIENLLRFSRLGRQPLSTSTVSISGLVRQVLGEMRREQAGRQIKLTVGELPDCLGDLSLLKQVFVNLLSNAFKYTRRKEMADIEIGCRQQSQEALNTYFVRDNGAGFDMKNAEKLFAVFQRLHRETEFEGTGVGLSIVQRIIHRHGGRIWAEAEIDQGATFYFTLPGTTGT